MKNTLKCSNNDINKFILLLRKGVYPYEYMDEWENLNETSLPEKGEIYRTLNMEILQMQITCIQKVILWLDNVVKAAMMWF